MRLIVCGGADYSRRDFIWTCLDRVHRKHTISTLLREDDGGASEIAGQWAISRLVGSTTYARDRRIPGSADPIDAILADGRAETMVAFPGGERIDEFVRRALEAGIKVWRPGE
ncbi:SLOG family protein [Falsiroseomonas sp. CW058]|uniref:SLOG family protein n=1 Tax=Falsiroseomonas sp. CW058 TaxID=3388664 RepID=UPI003D31467F